MTATDWHGLVWSAKDHYRLPQRLPLTDWFYSIEHSKLSPDGMDGYIYPGYNIPDSTYYKSTTSGANKLATLRR